MTDFGANTYVSAKRYMIARPDPEFGDTSNGTPMVCHDCAHLWNGAAIDTVCPECSSLEVGMAPRVRRTVPSGR